jgi:hypothetical protein
MIDGNNNIVFGSEVLAKHIAMEEKSEDYTLNIIQTPINLIQSAMDKSPSSLSYNRISWVVTYRAPKFMHLVSLWHQVRDHSSTARQYFNHTSFSLRSFLASPFLTLGTLDPLLAAIKLANYPSYDDSIQVQVVILDMSGVTHASRDISLVVLCEIVSRYPCREEEYNSILPEMLNKKDDQGLNDVTKEEALQIERILQRIDCNSVQDIQTNPRIRLMYSHLLHDTLSQCGNTSLFHHYSYEEAVRDIQRVLA